MVSYKRLYQIAGWSVFTIALIVYFFSAERTGSLWDCGEFILGAYKLQVVHPPGAPIFLLVGRIFTVFAELFSSNPEDIAFAVNLLSCICSAFAAAFIAWVTMMLGKLALVGREGTPDSGQSIAIAGAGLVAGLTTAFATSVWFSAVEGEVYAMSTFFTTLTLWSMTKWYSLPNDPQHDRWILFTVYAAGISIGVHLLSLLTFPALALFYYFKKYKNPTLLGMGAAAGVGVALIIATQTLVITGIPKLWVAMEIFTVNSLGLPQHSGLIPTLLIVGAAIFFGLRYAHQNNNSIVQNIVVGATLLVISFSTIGVVVIRANVNPPINMNAPSDATRLLPYINREQYGERPLLRGPHFESRIKENNRYEIEDRYGYVESSGKYEYVDQKISYNYQDQMLFPRIGDYSQNRPALYKQWMGLDPNKPLPPGRPNQLDNLGFLFRYQLGWMYWRYFMWNFSGRQNGEQGYYPWDKSSGHWISGVKFLDEARLYNQDDLPERISKNKGRNKYYMLPFLFGILGLLFHFNKRQNEALGLLALFVITGIGIIIYSNQPPNEPRERDYVLVGSFFTYAIWIGMGVLALFDVLRSRAKLSGGIAAGVATAVVLVAPLLMGFQNFDDHSRIDHSGARDYASNFLESCEPNAIIFTYGDNDTYPLWYAQEVENIRPDVRVVNLSLIAVDWYINLLRRRINDSPPIKMSIPTESYRGKKRNQVFYYNPENRNSPMPLKNFLQFIGGDNPVSAGRQTFESHYQTKNVYIPIDSAQAINLGMVDPEDADKIVRRIPLNLGRKEYLIKDEIAVLDVIGSNINDRPIYFAVTCRQDKLFGLGDYMQLEGLGIRIVPIKSQSDQAYGIIGSGRVDAQAVYENVMTKFRWGNFDKEALFVDRSYAPSIQSHQLVIRRAAFQLIREGEPEKAVEMIDKYFEVFPDMNFPYDYRAFYMISVYLQAEAYEQAKPHLEILAERTRDDLEFYESLDPEVIESSFETDYALAYRSMEDIFDAAKRAEDQEFLNFLNQIFGAYKLDQNNQEPTPLLD